MDVTTTVRNAKFRVGGLILASTVVLTASFIGVVAFLTGFVSAMEQRLPIYVLLTAVIFVVVLVSLDDENAPGGPVIVTTITIAALGFLLLTLSGEGLRYALARPGKLVSSQLVFYFVAAALFCSGVGFWALHHWREFTDEPTEQGTRY